jgi:hypothetical protein
MDFAALVTDQLKEAQIALDSLDGDHRLNSDRLNWLEGQLRHVTSELLALQSDIESGWSFADMGSTFSGDDFQEVMDVFRATISNLKSMIEMAKMLSR